MTSNLTGIGPVGFIGLGLLGQAMAMRLVAEGVDLVVWNREPERCAPLAEVGAAIAGSPREVAQRCKQICLCVLDEHAVRSVVFDADGIANAPNSDRIVVDFSTIDPDSTRNIAVQAAAAGLQWIDAPVSGGPHAAANGTLTVMVGGNLAAVESIRPLLRLVAGKFTHLGEAGTGQAMKVVNQAMVGGTFVLLAEALTLVRRMGLPANLVPSCLEGGVADSVALQCAWPRMVAEDFAQPTGRAGQLLKDLKNVERIVAAGSRDLPLLAAAIHQYAVFVERGGGAEETLSIVRLYQSAT